LEASTGAYFHDVVGALASKFVDAIAPAGNEQSTECVAAVSRGLLNARAAQERSRRKLESQVGEFIFACGSRVPGMRLVLGAGNDLGGENSRPALTINCSTWITTDMHSLNWADWADWKNVLFRHAYPLTTPAVRVTHLLAEHVLEHLDLYDAQSALSNAAQVLNLAGAIEGQPLPFLRLAVPDVGFGTIGGESSVSEMGNVASDIRDYHRIRYTARSLCALLNASGLDGYLLEWSHPVESTDHMGEIFGTGTIFDRAVNIQLNPLQGTMSRIHDYDVEQGRIQRSVRG
jgi:predicted SAM-dependent methyltransferase